MGERPKKQEGGQLRSEECVPEGRAQKPKAAGFRRFRRGSPVRGARVEV